MVSSECSLKGKHIWTFHDFLTHIHKFRIVFASLNALRSRGNAKFKEPVKFYSGYYIVYNKLVRRLATGQYTVLAS